MLRRLMEAGSELLFEADKKDSFDQYLESRAILPADPLEAISAHHSEARHLQRLREVSRTQQSFAEEAYALMVELLQKYCVADIPEERLDDLTSLLLPKQQPESDQTSKPEEPCLEE